MLKVSLSGISKKYNGRYVLKDCSYAFEQGKIYTVIGPNGSGKSTLLRIASSLEPPDEGHVTYHDGSSTIENNIMLMRRMTLVFPTPTLFNTTVFKNITYGLRIRGLSRNDVAHRVERVLMDVRLMDKINQNALTLSTGERQRLALARAIVLEPEIIFLDEPTASLDPHSVVIIEDIIRGLKKGSQPTIIMSTHNMFQAQRLADRVLFLYEGTIEADGSAAEFFDNPGDDKAWRFITGKMVY